MLIKLIIKFNVSKCKHLHFGPAHHNGPYYLNGILIDAVTSHSNLFDDQLDYTTHANRTYPIVSDCHTYNDVAKAFSEALEKEVTITTNSYE